MLFMKIKSYLIDKVYLFLFFIILNMIQLFFLFALNAPRDVMIASQILYSFMFIIYLVFDYHRRIPFYKKVDALFQDLDKKYLLNDMIDEPNFLEGKFFYHFMEDMNRYMANNIETFAHQEKEYQEYVNLWSHEIKTPLAASHLIIENHPSDITKSIAEELHQIDYYLEQILYYAKSTNIEKDYIIQAFDLLTCVQNVIKRHQKIFFYKHIHLHLEVASLPIVSDEKWITFILYQLLDNALKYTNEQGRIEIISKEHKENIEIMIKDNGIGIASQDLIRIFEKGFTGYKGRGHNKSTGMGLYLCKLLCNKLYIGLYIKSIEGQGTTISLIIPKNSMFAL